MKMSDSLILLINDDVRQQRQISKQINTDSFNAYTRSVQRSNLRELLGNALYYELFNDLINGWSSQSGTFTRVSNTVFTVDSDLSALSGQSLKVNDNYFYTVDSAVYSAPNTTITVTGYRALPTAISTLESKSETKFVKLLNGETYTGYSGNTEIYFGLYPFLSWHFLSSYINDASLKQADLGNVNLTDTFFNIADPQQLKRAQSEYLSNSVSQQNNIVAYLDEKSTDFTNWVSSSKQEPRAFDFMVI